MTGSAVAEAISCTTSCAPAPATARKFAEVGLGARSSRGPERDVSVSRRVKLGPEGVNLVAKLRHVVDTNGWLSADFHVHAAPSPDSIVPLSHRILELVADGIDMIVSTDHNAVTDYAPTIRQLGLGDLITSARGDELTTNGWGHYGAFPLPQDTARAGQGAILVHGHNAKEIFANVRAHAPETVIDVHHPRIDPGVGYFIVGESLGRTRAWR